MREPSFYRALAEDCIGLAHRAATPQFRLGLLNIAHIWVWMADLAEVERQEPRDR